MRAHVKIFPPNQEPTVIKMADSVDVLNFIQDLPLQIEQARLALTSLNVNHLELWHMRLEISANALAIIQDCLRNEDTVVFQNDLTTLTGQVVMVHNEIDQLLVDGRHRLIGDANINISAEQEHGFGRPRITITKEEIEREFANFRSWKVVAHLFGVSVKTLRRRRVEYGMTISSNHGPRQTYSVISQDELCELIRMILLTLPDIGETVVIGALRARGINVQRRRVRNALMEVDPVNRALRRTTAVMRRAYNVPSPNSLW